MYGAGDLISQKLEQRQAAQKNDRADPEWEAELADFRSATAIIRMIDYERALKFGLLGALLSPFGHWWYNFLSVFVEGSGVLPGLQRMVLDQFIFSPPFLAFTFGVLAIIENKPFDELVEQLRKEWAGAVVNIWKLWGPAQVINFILVPTHLQVLFDNAVGLIWNCYLSGVAHHSTGGAELPCTSSAKESASEPASREA